MPKTKHMLESELNDLQGNLYWCRRMPGRLLNIELLQLKINRIQYAIFSKEYIDEVNARGNIVERSFESASRYKYDSSLGSDWKQYDTHQDAYYFGIWVNVGERKILTYCEGDVSLVTCPTVESFKSEIRYMEQFYGPAPPAFIVWNLKQRRGYKIYGERPGINSVEIQTA